MSLGSDFGTPDDADAVAANAAADLGITMAISSGNSCDLYDVGGSPGSAQKAITVAASLDAQSIVDGAQRRASTAAATTSTPPSARSPTTGTPSPT